MAQKIYTVDAFTEEPFRGNPAGVCILPAPREEQWMQKVAREMSLSETAFLYPKENGFALRCLQPDFRAIAQIPVRGIIVTACSTDPKFDFISRFFAPASGVNEDPATGSSHCALGPYWQAKLGKTQLAAYQASARGGVLKVRVAGARVFLGGKAVTVVRGELAAEALAP